MLVAKEIKQILTTPVTDGLGSYSRGMYLMSSCGNWLARPVVTESDDALSLLHLAARVKNYGLNDGGETRLLRPGVETHNPDIHQSHTRSSRVHAIRLKLPFVSFVLSHEQ